MGGRRAAEGPGGAEVATAASMNSTRRSEKAAVLEEACQKGSKAQRPENVRAHVHIHTYTLCTQPRGPGLRIHCEIEEVTESSTNKQHTLSKMEVGQRRPCVGCVRL